MSNYLKQKEEQFLKFRIQGDTKLMLPLNQVTEVLKIGWGKIVPIPQMPSWVIGVYNWRGQVLWTIDLGHLIGFESSLQGLERVNHYTAIVLSYRGKSNIKNDRKISLGLIISDVEDTEWCDRLSIVSPVNSSVNDRLAPFLQGHLIKNYNGNSELSLVLDGDAIIASMPQ